MSLLLHRERRKREYKKVNEEFWTQGKRDLIKKKKENCVSIQKPNTENEAGNSTEKVKNTSKQIKRGKPKSKQPRKKSKK